MSSIVYKDLKWFLRITSAMLAFVAVYILETSSGDAVFPIVQSVQIQAPIELRQSVSFISLNLSVWVAFLLLVSSASYFILSTTGFGWYIRNLIHKLNFMRWLHHSISTSLMITITVLVAGINEALLLGLVFLYSVVVLLFGFLMELYNSRRKRVLWHSYITALGVTLSGWLLIAGSLIMTKYIGNVAITNSEWLLYGIITVFLGLFSLNMFLHYKHIGPWKDYVFDEKVYILVNFAAKSSFALVLYQSHLIA